jgi:hypothetical protein
VLSPSPSKFNRFIFNCSHEIIETENSSIL